MGKFVGSCSPKQSGVDCLPNEQEFDHEPIFGEPGPWCCLGYDDEAGAFSEWPCPPGYSGSDPNCTLNPSHWIWKDVELVDGVPTYKDPMTRKLWSALADKAAVPLVAELAGDLLVTFPPMSEGQVPAQKWVKDKHAVGANVLVSMATAGDAPSECEDLMAGAAVDKQKASSKSTEGCMARLVPPKETNTAVIVGGVVLLATIGYFALR
jgi:hypothetical protein